MMEITPELAEICGIHAGDGHLRKTRREFEVHGGIDEKEYYDEHIIPLFEKVFNVKIKGRFCLQRGTYGFSVSKGNIPAIIHSFGFPYGKKTLTVRIPKIIMNHKNPLIKIRFLRGYFDTDGCFTFCKKVRNSSEFQRTRNYYPRLLFTTVSQGLCKDVLKLLKDFDFRCGAYLYYSKIKTENIRYKTQIEGKENMKNWIKLIKPKNSSKYSRYLIWKKYKFCPPYTTYEERKSILNEEINPDSFYKGL